MLTYPWRRAENMRNTPDFIQKSAQNTHKQKITVADIVSTTVTDLARCTKKDILLFCVIEGIFSFINQESR